MITSLLRPAFFAASSLLAVTGLFAQSPAPKVAFPAASPAATVKQRVGLTDIEVIYSRPGVKGREIFGGLVPFDQVWRTGANTATKISFSTDVTLNGTAIPAGHYELFTIPGRDEWTVIIHQDVSEWGAFTYDAKKDVARFTAKPVALAEPVESFTIGFNDLRDESATLNLSWDQTRVPVKIEVNLTATLVPQIESLMASDAKKKPYAQAAMFYLDHDLDLKKASDWIDAAIAAQPDAFYLIYQKARILARSGDKAGATAAAQKSMELAGKADPVAKDEYLRLNKALLARLRG
jgi:hypothetical protein